MYSQKFLQIGIRPEVNPDIPDYYSLIMQACWNDDPDLRPTSRDLEKTFNSWIDSIANRQLVCPKVLSAKELENVNLGTKDTHMNSSYNSTPSQPLPSLSIVQLQYLEELDEQRK